MSECCGPMSGVPERVSPENMEKIREIGRAEGSVSQRTPCCSVYAKNRPIWGGFLCAGSRNFQMQGAGVTWSEPY